MPQPGVGFSDYQQDILKTAASSSAFLSLLACCVVLIWCVRGPCCCACECGPIAFFFCAAPCHSYESIPRLRTSSFNFIAILIACNGASSLALLVDLGNGSTIDNQSHGLCVSTAAFVHFFDVAGFCWYV